MPSHRLNFTETAPPLAKSPWLRGLIIITLMLIPSYLAFVNLIALLPLVGPYTFLASLLVSPLFCAALIKCSNRCLVFAPFSASTLLTLCLIIYRNVSPSWYSTYGDWGDMLIISLAYFVLYVVLQTIAFLVWLTIRGFAVSSRRRGNA